jgi:hypothetical protein
MANYTIKMAPEMSAFDEFGKSIQIVNPTENEIATLAYHLWLDSGCPIASDQEHWFRAEAMLKDALPPECEGLSSRPSIPCSDTRIESVNDFIWELEGHWEVWEREWGGARWVCEVRGSHGRASNRAA